MMHSTPPPALLDDEVKGEPISTSARTRLLTRIGIGVVVLGCAAFGLRWYLRTEETTEHAKIVARTVRVAPETTGRVRAVHVEEHQEVEAGALLLELDPEVAELGARRARATLALAEAALKQLKTRQPNTTRQAEAILATSRGDQAAALAMRSTAAAEESQAEAAVAVAQAQVELARADLARAEQLAKDGAIPEAQLQSARSKAAQAEAELRKERANVAAARARGSAADAARLAADGRVKHSMANSDEALLSGEIVLAEARIEDARAVVARAELELRQTKITAPMRGVVERRNVVVGSVIGAGDVALMLVSTEDVWVEAHFKETQLGRLRAGQGAQVRIDADPKTLYMAHVDRIGGATTTSFSPLPPEMTGSSLVRVPQRVPLRLRFDGALPPHHAAGLNATVSVETAGPKTP